MWQWSEGIKRRVRLQELHFSSNDDETLMSYIDHCISEIASEEGLGLSDRIALSQIVFNSFRRLDVIQPLLDDEAITEIMVNGPHEIFIEVAGRVHRTAVSFESRERLEQIIQTIVSKVNRQVTELNPIVDARLEDGSRINAVLYPVALNGPILTIRKFIKEPMTLERLIDFGAIDVEVADCLRALVIARYNIFISGGTGSGKTSFLNALSQCIPSDERVITIEDSAELQINTVQNLIRLETRPPNIEGAGELTIQQLIRSSLRMRPDRIIVGEVRGSEAIDMLQAMNTGHDGSISTGHANSPQDMLGRLETMVLSGIQMPVEAIRAQIASAVDIMIHLGRLRDKTRRVIQICEVLGVENGQLQLNPLFAFEENTLESSRERVVGKLNRTTNTFRSSEKLLNAGLEVIL
jgi:pilus assembly protein CpaF